MIKIPISGGPHSGKTTLINELRHEYAGAYFVEEPAEKVILGQLELEKKNKGYKGIYPVESYPKFSALVLREALQLESDIPEDARLVFQDRSLIDNLAYDSLNEVISPPELIRGIKAASYTLAFFCEPVGDYTPTAVRHESREHAARIHAHLSQSYERAELPIVSLPAVSVAERLQIIREAVTDVGAV